MSRLADKAIDWTEQGLVPDSAIRAGIRRLLTQRLSDIQAGDASRAAELQNVFVEHMHQSPVALVPELANEQHYEVPAGFFDLVLGERRKYSSCYWGETTTSLDDAEKLALEITCERAGIADGMDVLDLGCGWGSVSLWIAENYPASCVTAVSNSSSQRAHIEATAAKRGIENLTVLTCDMNDFEAPGHYDRVISVEMFEHMRNYAVLYERINGWLKPNGRFFMHIFCHRLCTYPFEDKGPSDWMSRHFFSGGIMPSKDLPLRFQKHLTLKQQWIWDGRHYEKTSNAWLRNMDERQKAIMPLLSDTYGADNAVQWFNRWRVFFMACAELFGYAQGQEWFVSHYLFSGRPVE